MDQAFFLFFLFYFAFVSLGTLCNGDFSRLQNNEETKLVYFIFCFYYLLLFSFFFIVINLLTFVSLGTFCNRLIVTLVGCRIMERLKVSIFRLFIIFFLFFYYFTYLYFIQERLQVSRCGMMLNEQTKGKFALFFCFFYFLPSENVINVPFSCFLATWKNGQAERLRS